MPGPHSDKPSGVGRKNVLDRRFGREGPLVRLLEVEGIDASARRSQLDWCRSPRPRPRSRNSAARRNSTAAVSLETDSLAERISTIRSQPRTPIDERREVRDFVLLAPLEHHGANQSTTKEESLSVDPVRAQKPRVFPVAQLLRRRAGHLADISDSERVSPAVEHERRIPNHGDLLVRQYSPKAPRRRSPPSRYSSSASACRNSDARLGVCPSSSRSSATCASSSRSGAYARAS